MISNWSLEEYNDPELYDLENYGNPELPLLISLAEETNTKGPILDLACGTGRTAIPFAEAGYHIIGIDIHKGMLEQARKKTPASVDIKWLEQDCLNLKLEEQSHLSYMVGHAFQHFLTNEHQNQLLQSLHNVLHPGGLFVFHTRFPSVTELLQPPTEVFWKTITDQKNRKCDIYTKMHFDPVSQIQHYIVIRRFYEQNQLVEEKETTIDLRYTFPQEIERILSANGFQLLHLYDGWKQRPVTSDCYSMVVICKKI